MSYQYMTLKEFADRLRLGRRKIYVLIEKKIVNPSRVGGTGSYRFSEDNVKEALGEKIGQDAKG